MKRKLSDPVPPPPLLGDLTLDEKRGLAALAEYCGQPPAAVVERLIALGVVQRKFGGPSLTSDGRRLYDELRAAPHFARKGGFTEPTGQALAPRVEGK